MNVIYSSGDTREIAEDANAPAPGGHASVTPVPSVTPIPEPASVALLGVALLGLALGLRRS